MAYPACVNCTECHQVLYQTLYQSGCYVCSACHIVYAMDPRMGVDLSREWGSEYVIDVTICAPSYKRHTAHRLWAEYQAALKAKEKKRDLIRSTNPDGSASRGDLSRASQTEFEAPTARSWVAGVEGGEIKPGPEPDLSSREP